MEEQRGWDDREHANTDYRLAGVVRRLEQAGAVPEDVVKVRIFVKDFEPDQYSVISEVRLATFPEGHWPASTMIGVRALAAETLRVEIEAIAVVAEPGADLEIERFAPANGFSGAVAVTAHGVKTVYVAGQVGGGDTLAAQTTAVWGRVGQQLEAAGASFFFSSPFSPATNTSTFRNSMTSAAETAGGTSVDSVTSAISARSSVSPRDASRAR